MSSVRSAPVAIIGGGFSGTMLAAQLARRGIASLLIDGSGRIGRGTAYSTTQPAHLLNIPAERMSAWPEDLADFKKLIEARGGSGKEYVERRLYGDYLTDILERAVASGHVRTAEAEAIEAKRAGGTWLVALADGTSVEAGSLVLAIGNQQPGVPELFEAAGDRFVADPWGPSAIRAVSELAATGGDALILGTGLTMVDLALSLDAAGHRGRIVALSRRGLLPRSHVYSDAPKLEVALDEVPLGDLRTLARWLRARAARTGWRNAVDSLRPHSHRIWASLDLAQQHRFLRHARAWWDVHRHRIAPPVADTIAAMIGDGRLEVMAARVVGVEPEGDGLLVSYRRRGSDQARTMRAGFVFNCTGPLHAMSDSRNPLIRGLLDSGAAEPDQLDIGLAVDEHSRVIGSDRLWALGALTKARYWEIIAVPDIRGQVAAVARDIEMELGR
jgi:uncharacterized NAD(P)/FAD-binding protein YdhS